MKIDLVITELDVGGAEKALTALAAGLHRRGHRVRVLSIGSPPPQERYRLVEQLEDLAIPVNFGGFDRTAQAFAAFRWLVDQLRREPADLCQTFLFHANCLGSWAANRAGVPRVVAGLRVAEHKRWRLLCERLAVARMDRVVCVSSAVRDFAIQTLGGPAERYPVIGNGVDVARYGDAEPFDWTRLGWPLDAEVALFVGRLHRQKGLELITEQWPEIAAGDPRRRLLIVGDGPLRASIERWAGGKNAPRVRVLPWQDDVAPLMKASRMLLLPSHYEGMPNVVLEAMAAGRAVVCSRVQGSEELLSEPAGGDPSSDASGDVDRRTPQSFAVGDGDAMARRVIVLFEDGDLADRLGHCNQQHVQRHFSYAEMVSRYETLYASLIRDG